MSNPLGSIAVIATLVSGAWLARESRPTNTVQRPRLIAAQSMIRDHLRGIQCENGVCYLQSPVESTVIESDNPASSTVTCPCGCDDPDCNCPHATTQQRPPAYGANGNWKTTQYRVVYAAAPSYGCYGASMQSQSYGCYGGAKSSMGHHNGDHGMSEQRTGPLRRFFARRRAIRQARWGGHY